MKLFYRAREKYEIFHPVLRADLARTVRRIGLEKSEASHPVRFYKICRTRHAENFRDWKRESSRAGAQVPRFSSAIGQRYIMESCLSKTKVVWIKSKRETLFFDRPSPLAFLLPPRENLPAVEKNNSLAKNYIYIKVSADNKFIFDIRELSNCTHETSLARRETKGLGG